MNGPRSIRVSAITPVPSRRTVLRGLAGGGLATAFALATSRRLAAEAAQDATPAALPPLIEEWAAVWGGEPDRADALYAEDAVLEDMAAGVSFPGRDEIKTHVEELMAGFPDLAYELHTGLVAGDFAAAEFTFTGTYTGSFPGLPSGTDQAVALRGAVFMELADGKIRREAHYYDAYAFLVQLGLLPAPEAGAEGTPAG